MSEQSTETPEAGISAPEEGQAQALDAMLAEIVTDDDNEGVTIGTLSADEADENTSETPSEGTETQVDQEALHGAYTALYRDGLGQEVIDTMTDEMVLAYGAKAQKRQTDVDAAFRERDRLRSLSKEDSKPDESTEEPATAQPTGDPSTVLRDLETPLGELIGDEEASAVSSLMRGAFERLVTPLLQQNAAMSDALAMRMMQQEMSGDFPQLSSSGEFQKVSSRAIELMSTQLHSDLEGFDRLRALMETAVKLDTPDGARPEVAAKKRKGHMQGAVGRKARQKSLSAEETLDAKIQMAMQGKSSDEIRAAYGD